MTRACPGQGRGANPPDEEADYSVTDDYVVGYLFLESSLAWGRGRPGLGNEAGRERGRGEGGGW